MTAESTPRIEYQPRTPDEVLEIDPATGKPIIITRPALNEIEMGIPYALVALVVIALVIVVIACLIFFDIFFGQTAP